MSGNNVYCFLACHGLHSERLLLNHERPKVGLLRVAEGEGDCFKGLKHDFFMK